MATRSQYNTKQREQIMDFILTKKDGHFSVSDVMDYCAENDIHIGQTTVYRHLEKMVDEGILNKYFVDLLTPACFEYTSGKHTHSGQCFHLKCEKCGKLLHLQCDMLEHIDAHLEEDHGFLLDTKRTVFYGICGDCRRKMQEKV